MDTFPQTWGSHVTVCRECGTEVAMLTLAHDGRPIIMPCGHSVELAVVPNPRLPKATV